MTSSSRRHAAAPIAPLRAALLALLLTTPPPDAALAQPPLLAPKHDDGGGTNDHGGGIGDPTIQPLPALGSHRCQRGRAKGYPCHNVDLVSFVPLAALSPAPDERARGVWGWSDPHTGREYAIVPLATGTSFVDVTPGDPPLVVGFLPGTGGGSVFNREANVYADHAFIVADGPAAATHGIQVFDLARLRDVTAPPAAFTPTTTFTGVGRVHTLTVDGETGFAFANGSDQCGGGLFFLDVRQPAAPRAAGCHSAHGYVHDSQCLVYRGPDARYAERQLCFASNQDRLLIVDVTDKGAPRAISETPYPGVGYTHQGWLTGDHRWFLLDDEGDEVLHGHNSRTWIWDLEDLEAPRVVGSHEARSWATDHNQYVHDGFLYQANYRAGLRILDLAKIAGGRLTEVGFFDVVPEGDEPGFSGAWNVYPFLPSGRLLVSGIEQGLYVLRWNGSRKPSAAPEKVPAKCRAGKNNLCMLGGRIRVDAAAERPKGPALPGRLAVVPGTPFATVSFDPGGDPDVVFSLTEQDGLPLLGYVELTARPFTLRLMDIGAKKVRRHHNREACRRVAGFGGTGGGAGSCEPSSERLCLGNGRFAMEATWNRPGRPAEARAAQAVPLSSATGGFTSREPGTLDLAAKLTVVGDAAEVRWGRLRNLEYRLRVTDTVTGATHELTELSLPNCLLPKPVS